MLRFLVAGFLGILLSLTASACGSSGGPPAAHVATGPLHVAAGGLGRFRKPGADNSLEGFGHEGSGPELEQAAVAVHAYLVAWVEEDWAAACASASSELHRILERPTQPSPKAKRGGCVEAIAEVAGGEPPLGRTLYEATDMEAVALREERSFGYLFFYLGKTGYQQEVFRKDERWEVKAPLPSAPH
jgi:hypothetical protein